MFRRYLHIFAVVVLLAVMLLPVVGVEAADSWHLTSWQYRIKLALNNSDTGGVLSDHRVLINLNTNRVNYADFLSSGQDIRFTDAQGNLLAHHIAVWKENSDNSYIWVKVPSITNDNNTYIYMYYGNSSASDAQNIAGVWGTAYQGLWLFNDKSYAQRDYGEYASDAWGDLAMPWGLGFPVTYDTDYLMGPNRMWPSEAPYAVYSSDQQKTFVVFPGGPKDGQGRCPFDPYITYYDHAASPPAWRDSPYKLGDAIATSRYDNHNAPVVLIDGSKYLHVFNGNHADPIQHWKSTYPLDNANWSLTGWTAKSSINFEATYIYAVKASGGNIYVFGRNSKVQEDPKWHEPLSYVKSTNGGESWGDVVDLINPAVPPDGGGYGTIYPTHLKYKTSPSEGVHIVFHLTKDHSDYQRYHGYAFFKFSDDKAYAVNGTDMGTSVSQAEMDDYCWFLNEGADREMAINGIVDLDENGRPHIFLILTDSVVFTFVPSSTCIFETFGVILTGALSKWRSICYPQVVKENAAKKKTLTLYPMGRKGSAFLSTGRNMNRFC